MFFPLFVTHEFSFSLFLGAIQSQFSQGHSKRGNYFTQPRQDKVKPMHYIGVQYMKSTCFFDQHTQHRKDHKKGYYLIDMECLQSLILIQSY